jgi:hypothetical protein
VNASSAKTGTELNSFVTSNSENRPDIVPHACDATGEYWALAGMAVVVWEGKTWQWKWSVAIARAD